MLKPVFLLGLQTVHTLCYDIGYTTLICALKNSELVLVHQYILVLCPGTIRVVLKV